MKLTTLSKDNQNKKALNPESILEYQQIDHQNTLKDITTTLINRELKQDHNCDNENISN
jgi:hypothetical protein